MNQHVFADRLHELCKRKHMSVETLAEAIHRSPRQVNRYRNGQCKNIPLDVLYAIADTLEVSLTDLLS